MRIVLISAMILLVTLPALGQQTFALGLTPGPVAVASGYEGAYQDSAAQMVLAAEFCELKSPFCELALPNITTKREQMGLTSEEATEATLLERPGPLEVPKSKQVKLAPEKAPKVELTSEEATEATLLEGLGPLEVPKSAQVKLAPEKAPKAPKMTTGAEMLYPGEEMESGAFEPALAHGAEIPASEREAAKMIIEPAPKPQKFNSGDISLERNLCRLERLGLVNYYHNMEVLEHGRRIL